KKPEPPKLKVRFSFHIGGRSCGPYLFFYFNVSKEVGRANKYAQLERVLCINFKDSENGCKLHK
ncbi:MAG: hypothetical protein OSB29_13620, partial [Verrucomicrobiota bacterium]|nr:hypothetical protein [Verrucomicrobiota bacterium]